MQVKKTLFCDFDARFWNFGLLPLPNDVEYDVIVGEGLEVGIDTEQNGRAIDLDTGLFHQFAAQRDFQRLTLLDPASGEMPAGPISVTNEQNAVLVIYYDALRPKRKPARHSPVALQDPRY